MSRRGGSTSSSSFRGGRAGVGLGGARITGVGGTIRSDSPMVVGGSSAGSSVNGAVSSTAGATAVSLQRQVGPRMPMPPDPSRRIADYSSPDDKCPQCKTDRYLNPKLRLLVSPCYHEMCESCLDRIFSLGPAPCPECGQKCRKYEFGVQTFQDLRVEKEVDVRRRIGKLFNKREEDFDDLKSYNNYLEEVESILFNLINNVDVANTEARIAAYQASNKTSIQTNTRNLAAEGDAQRALEEAEKSQRAARAVRRKQREERDRVEAEQDERELVDAMAGRGAVGVDAMLKRKHENEQMRIERMEREELEEDLLARQHDAANKAAFTQAKNANGRTTSATTQQRGDDGWPVPFHVDMLLDFEGPLARLDDARDLYDVYPTPAELGGTSTAASGPQPTYEDFWITSTLEKDEVSRLRAAGYDWSLNWQRDIRAANMGIGLRALQA